MYALLKKERLQLEIGEYCFLLLAFSGLLWSIYDEAASLHFILYLLLLVLLLSSLRKEVEQNSLHYNYSKTWPISPPVFVGSKFIVCWALALSSWLVQLLGLRLFHSRVPVALISVYPLSFTIFFSGLLLGFLLLISRRLLFHFLSAAVLASFWLFHTDYTVKFSPELTPLLQLSVDHIGPLFLLAIAINGVCFVLCCRLYRKNQPAA